MIILWFFLTALVYASAGFGGGSTYTALLVIAGVDHRVLPLVSLACNLVVVSGSCWRFHRRGEIDWRRSLPLIMVSIPLAAIGGLLPIERSIFVLTLGIALMVSGLLLLLVPPPDNSRNTPRRATGQSTWWQVGLGGALGLLAGIVGIGGGIFLSPVLHLMNWASARTIAATCSLFILINSLAGLAGQLIKTIMMSSSDSYSWSTLHQSLPLWPWLLLAVFVGGQVGNRATTQWFTAMMLRRVTAMIVLWAAGRMLWISFAASV